MEKHHIFGPLPTKATNRCYACLSHTLSSEKYKHLIDLPKVAYHRFPSKPDICKQWLQIRELNDLQQYPTTKLNKKYRLCSLHFEKDQFTNSLCQRLNFNAVPSLFGKLDDLIQGGSSITRIVPQVVPDATLPNLDNRSQVENAVQNEEKCCSNSGALSLEPQDLGVCRLCATLSDKKNIMNIFDAEGCMQKISIKINALMPITVSEDDILPLSVCRPCCAVVDKAYELWKVCLAAKVLLNHKYIEQQHSPEEGNCDLSLPILNAEPVVIQETTSSSMEPMDTMCVVSSPSLPQFWCSDCKLGFTNARSYKSHEVKCHQRSVIWCNECPLFFTRLQQLSDHFHEIHPNQKTGDIISKQLILTSTRKRYSKIKNKYKCYKCKKSFASSDFATYNAHLKDHCARKAKKVRQIKCNHCDFKFPSESTRRLHMVALHEEYQSFTCEQCGKTFNSKEGLKRHVSIHSPYNQIVCEICGKFCRSVQHHIKRVHNKVNCKFCGKSFAGALLIQHLDINHFEERKFRCDMCGHSWYYPEELMKHKKKHSKPHMECLICGRLYLSPDTAILHSHMYRSHMDSKTKSFTCPVTSCRAPVSQLIDFLKHLEIHAKEEFPKIHSPYDAIVNTSALLCSYCGLSFNLMSMYASHIYNEHRMCSEIVMTCNICNASLPEEESMTKHLENHSEAFTFHCQHCKEVFVTDKQSECHILKVHRKCHKCEYCPKIFKSTTCLKNHLVSHTKEKNYDCCYCGCKFSLKGHVRRHILRKHKV